MEEKILDVAGIHPGHKARKPFTKYSKTLAVRQLFLKQF